MEKFSLGCLKRPQSPGTWHLTSLPGVYRAWQASPPQPSLPFILPHFSSLNLPCICRESWPILHATSLSWPGPKQLDFTLLLSIFQTGDRCHQNSPLELPQASVFTITQLRTWFEMTAWGQGKPHQTWERETRKSPLYLHQKHQTVSSRWGLSFLQRICS